MKQGDQIEVKGSSVFLLKGEGPSMLLPFPHHTLSKPSATTQRTTDLASSTDVPCSVDAHPLDPAVWPHPPSALQCGLAELSVLSWAGTGG